MRWYGILALALLVPAISSAQSFGSLGGTDAVSVSVAPDYPAPYGEAFLSVVSSTIDLAAATMRVRVNGKTIHDGSVTSVSIPLGAAGVVQNVSVDITSRDQVVHRDLAIQPQDVALVAEPFASVPPLYPGRPHIPLGGNVRLVALANLRTAGGAAIDPATASYRWSVNGEYRANSSGIGKTSLLVTSPLQYRSATVAVTVTSPQGSLVGGDSFSFVGEEPTLRLYTQDPLLGVRFENALGSSYTIPGAEATLYAGAYSFPTNSPLSLEWFVDGKSVHLGKSITLRPSGDGKGTSSLSLVAGTPDSTKTNFVMSLSFDTNKSSNFFGL